MSLPTPVVRAPTPSFFNKPLFRIQSASLTVTNADPDANNVFNTNLGAINVQQAMVIHRMDIQCNVQAVMVAGLVNAIVMVLTEDSSATSALTAGGGTRTLWFGERDFQATITTTGGHSQIYDAVFRVNLDPWPIWTIAQELNWLSELAEITAGAAPDYITKIDLWYSLEPVDATLRSRLIERLNLAL